MPDDPFLQAIRQRPNAHQTCLVYADWLEERGDPRGPFMRCQCLTARLPPWSPRRLALEAEAHALRMRHEEEWLGPLLGVASNWEFRRGLLHSVTLDAATFLAHAAQWLPAVPLVGVHLRKAHGHIADLAACPQLAHLNALYLGANDLTDEDLEVLLASPHLHNLKELYLHSNSFGDTGLKALAACPHLPRLRDLSIGYNRVGRAGLKALAANRKLGRLRHLNLLTTLKDKEALEVLVDSPLLGRLRSLFLTCNLLPAGALKPLVQSPAFGGVRVLTYDMNDSTDADILALAASPHVRNLTKLALTSNRQLGDASLAALAGSPNLRRLRCLVFGPGPYGGAGLKALGRSRSLCALRSLHLESGQEEMHTVAHHLLRGPLIRRLHDLSLGYCSAGPKGLEALASHPAPLRLRHLDFLLQENAAPAWEALLARGSLGNVTHLRLHDVSAAALESLSAPGRLPQLRKLTVNGLPADAPATGKFLDSPLVRQLHELSLYTCQEERGEEILKVLLPTSAESPLQQLELCWSLHPRQVEILTAGAKWPLLDSLLIGTFRAGVQGIRRLAAWPLLRQLRSLTLQNSSSSEVPGVEAFAQSEQAGPLLRVDLRNAHVSKEAQPLLRQRFGLRFAPSGRQEPRVISVGGWARLRGDDD
jgi:uncharacterized protein (TIGR02996 family)